MCLRVRGGEGWCVRLTTCHRIGGVGVLFRGTQTELNGAKGGETWPQAKALESLACFIKLSKDWRKPSFSSVFLRARCPTCFRQDRAASRARSHPLTPRPPRRYALVFKTVNTKQWSSCRRGGGGGEVSSSKDCLAETLLKKKEKLTTLHLFPLAQKSCLGAARTSLEACVRACVCVALCAGQCLLSAPWKGEKAEHFQTFPFQTTATKNKALRSSLLWEPVFCDSDPLKELRPVQSPAGPPSSVSWRSPGRGRAPPPRPGPPMRTRSKRDGARDWCARGHRGRGTLTNGRREEAERKGQRTETEAARC